MCRAWKQKIKMEGKIKWKTKTKWNEIKKGCYEEMSGNVKADRRLWAQDLQARSVAVVTASRMVSVLMAVSMMSSCFSWCCRVAAPGSMAHSAGIIRTTPATRSRQSSGTDNVTTVQGGYTPPPALESTSFSYPRSGGSKSEQPEVQICRLHDVLALLS